MNCAAVEVISTNSSADTPTPSGYSPNISARGNPRQDASFVTFKDRPLMFVADDGNDCLTPHTTAELKYPFPGPDVVPGDGAYPLELPSGECDPSQMLSKQGYNGATGNDGHV